MEELNGIAFSMVMDLNLFTSEVIYRTGNNSHPVEVLMLDKEDLNRFKFELIKWLRLRPHPADRILPFETEVDGVWSYDKELKLTEARKTRDEKGKEMEYKSWLSNECKKRGIK